MITRETAARIWSAYREIETAENLLQEMETKRQELRVDQNAPTIKDAFGRIQHLQLGIPSGDNAHRLFQVSPVLAVSVIRAHIAAKQSELAEANECARLELESNPATEGQS